MWYFKCKFCNKEFNFDKKGGPGGHARNCILNPNRLELIENNKIDKKEYTFNCKKCNSKYSVVLSEGNLKKGTYKKYCSRNCSNGHIVSSETKLKISNTIKSKLKNNKKSYFHTCRCIVCDNIFKFKHKRKTCSDTCKIISIRNGGRKGGLISAKKMNLRSKNEIEFAQLCKNYFSNIITNEPIFNGWDADVIIPELKIAVLWNGPYHYKQIKKGQSLKQVQNRDEIKINEIIKFGYVPVIIKDESKFSRKYVLTKFNEFVKTYVR